MSLLSVIIPVYNEKSTLPEIIRLVQEVNINKEIIIIDDLKGLNEIPKGPTKKVLYRILQEYYTNKM